MRHDDSRSIVRTKHVLLAHYRATVQRIPKVDDPQVGPPIVQAPKRGYIPISQVVSKGNDGVGGVGVSGDQSNDVFTHSGCSPQAQGLPLAP